MSHSKAVAIEFFDEEENDKACVIVRRLGDKIGVTISLRSNGDLETFMDEETTARLIRTLENVLGKR